MMASRDVPVTGLSELNDLLQQLPVDIEKKLLRGALRAGQAVVADAARQQLVANGSSNFNTNGNKVLGALAKSIRISAKVRGATATATLKAGDASAFYAHFVEFGTKAHVIKPKSAKALAFGGVIREDIHHPGAMKKPFMRPALDLHARDGSPAFQAVARYLEGRISAEIAKLTDEADG